MREFEHDFIEHDSIESIAHDMSAQAYCSQHVLYIII